MSRRASLPMYDLPGLRWATDAWWSGLAEAIRAAGIADVPDRLTRSAAPAEDWSDPSLLLSQTCGHPLTHDFADRLVPLATPCYGVPGCDGPYYSSLIVVAAGSPVTDLAALRGAVCAVNGWDSQSGWNALAAATAGLAGPAPFFRAARVTGSHAASLRAVASGDAAVAAIDAVTFALLGRTESGTTAGVRVLAATPGAPGLPYVGRADAPAAEIAGLRQAILAACRDPGLAPVRAALGIAGAAVLDRAAYAPVAAMARIAQAQRPPALP